MNDPVKSFGGVASGLARGPLGIIALFIVLVYGFASLVTAFGASLSSSERLPLIYFMVIFPVLVLIIFSWLVSKHSSKLYPPTDYKDEKNFLEIQRMQLSAVASLAVASARQDGSSSTPDVDQVVQAVQRVSARAKERSVRSILWVDDRPTNNTYTQRAFQSVGVNVELALSTQEAINLLGERDFDAIISDMGRKEGPREGYVLLEKIRANGVTIPFFIHAASSSTQHRAETARHGGQGCTSDPSELFDMVMSALSV